MSRYSIFKDKITRLTLLVVIASSIVGCASTGSNWTMPPEMYKAMQTGLRTSPEYRRKALAICLRHYDATPLDFRQRVAAREHIPLKSVSLIKCRRLLSDVAKNRKTYNNYKKLGT